MSEIPFVQALGDALERAITADAARTGVTRSARRPRWMRFPRVRGRLLVGLAALAFGGAALANSLQSSTRLAAGTVDCGYSTSNPGSTDPLRGGG